MKKQNWYFIPLILSVFFLTYRNYQFYLNKPWQIFKFVKLDLSKNLYEEVQQHHPYYEIYKVAETYRNQTDYQIIYYSNKTEKKYLDYNSSLYATANARNGKFVEKYLSEVNLMINYFFYPKIIPVTYIYFEIKNLINSSNGKLLIISDMELQTKLIHFNNLKRITYPEIDNNKIYRPVEPFYIYQKI
jgi:hypothetical protein